MRKLDRPDEPSDFRVEVASAYASVARTISKGASPAFPSLWSKFKPIFAKAQLGKCGYCEGQVHGLQYGDVEHIQPKAEVHDLADDPNEWGEEVPWSSKVRNRNTKKEIERPGYWWRAYAWDNYLLSCQTCNQQWKRNLYPVNGHRILGPTPNDAGEPLLLSPFDESLQPHEHFAYGRLGEIRGLTPHGRATIATCGLDRPSLRLARQKLASATHDYLDEVGGDLTERELLRLLRTIERDGADVQPYCGMVRTIFRQRTNMDWTELATLIGRLATSRTPDHSLCDC